MYLKPDSVLIGFDFGTKKTGVAIAQCITRTASTLKAVQMKQERPNWNQLDQIINDYKPDFAVIGSPGRTSQETSALTEKVENFASAVEKRYTMSTELFDESYTTRLATEELKNQRKTGILNKKIKKGQVDSMAAKILLEHWLELHLMNS
jgi:putative Holliday junction resolvase